MNFIFILISSSDPDLLQKKKIDKTKNKKTMALGENVVGTHTYTVKNKEVDGQHEAP